MSEKSLKFRLSALYFIVCGALACYYPFMLIYYQGNKLNYSQIGTLFAINSLIAVIAQPLWGILTDKYLNTRKSFLLALALSSILVLGFLLVKGYVPISIWVVIFVIFQSPILSLNDAFCYEVIDSNKSLQYGKLRLMGSIGYAVIALIMALVIKHTSVSSSFFAFALLGALGVTVLKGIKVKSGPVRNVLDFNDVASVLKNRRFLLLAISAMPVSASMNANSNYLATLIQSTHGDVSNIGFLWFIIAISELPAFYFGGKLFSRFGEVNMYLTSLGFYILRFLLDSFCGQYQLVIAVQLLQAITYPLYIMATLQCISNTVPNKARTTAITVFAAITGGIGGFIGSKTGGLIIQTFNVFILFRVMSVLCIISLFIGLALKNNKSSLKAKE